jgi:XTP/dITP diphosphohydrolase
VSRIPICIATSNPGKAREFRDMLGADRFAWTDLAAQAIAPIEETGATFRANACLKASYYARRLNAWALADDSGLCVDALGGKPGVHSARWADMHNAGIGNSDNNLLLLKQLQELRAPADARTARFRCVLALADPKGQIILTAEGAVEGTILQAPRGSNGFGYDPLFRVAEHGKSMAELIPEEKHRISHRGRALRRLKLLLSKIAELRS